MNRILQLLLLAVLIFPFSSYAIEGDINSEQVNLKNDLSDLTSSEGEAAEALIDMITEIEGANSGSDDYLLPGINQKIANAIIKWHGSMIKGMNHTGGH